jgi:multicomponent Na+:H+ antiporter subunit G
MLQSVAGNGLVVAGTVLVAAAAVGILRLPDVFNRTNAVAKAVALGVSLILAGVLVLTPSPTTTVIVVLAIAAQLFTAPIAGYAVARAAYRSGAPMTPSTYRDDLTGRRQPRQPPG